MNGRMNTAFERGRKMLAGFTAGQRAMLAVAVVGLVVAVVALSRFAAQPSWTPLFSNLSGSDASAVVEQLKAQGAQYQLTNGGSTVLVPESQVYDLRVALAGKNLPAGDTRRLVAARPAGHDEHGLPAERRLPARPRGRARQDAAGDDRRPDRDRAPGDSQEGRLHDHRGRAHRVRAARAAAGRHPDPGPGPLGDAHGRGQRARPEPLRRHGHRRRRDPALDPRGRHGGRRGRRERDRRPDREVRGPDGHLAAADARQGARPRPRRRPGERPAELRQHRDHEPDLRERQRGSAAVGGDLERDVLGRERGRRRRPRRHLAHPDRRLRCRRRGELREVRQDRRQRGRHRGHQGAGGAGQREAAHRGRGPGRRQGRGEPRGRAGARRQRRRARPEARRQRPGEPAGIRHHGGAGRGQAARGRAVRRADAATSSWARRPGSACFSSWR